MPRVDRLEIVAVRLGVEAAEFQDLSDKSEPRPALNLYDDVERVRDVRLNGSIWHLDAALQYASCETRNTLGRRIGMNGRDRSAVPRVQKLQKIKRFAAANFAQYDSVWTMAQSRFQKVADRHGG